MHFLPQLWASRSIRHCSWLLQGSNQDLDFQNSWSWSLSPVSYVFSVEGLAQEWPYSIFRVVSVDIHCLGPHSHWWYLMEVKASACETINAQGTSLMPIRVVCFGFCSAGGLTQSFTHAFVRVQVSLAAHPAFSLETESSAFTLSYIHTQPFLF